MFYLESVKAHLDGNLKNMSKKEFCYKESCEFVDTGWLTIYKVCKTCKLEVSESLCERKIEEKQLQKLREEQKKKDEEDGRSTIFEFLDFPYD